MLERRASWSAVRPGGLNIMRGDASSFGGRRDARRSMRHPASCRRCLRYRGTPPPNPGKPAISEQRLETGGAKMTFVGEDLSQPVAAHDEEGEMVDDARPADAIRSESPPCLLPVVIGGKKHALSPFERIGRATNAARELRRATALAHSARI